jgi:hypothetical protein
VGSRTSRAPPATAPNADYSGKSFSAATIRDHPAQGSDQYRHQKAGDNESLHAQNAQGRYGGQAGDRSHTIPGARFHRMARNRWTLFSSWRNTITRAICRTE